MNEIRIWVKSVENPFILDGAVGNQFVQKFKEENYDFIVAKDEHLQLVLKRDEIIAVSIQRNQEDE